MYILALGSEYFHEAFVRQGHKVVAPPMDDGFPLGEFYHSLVDRPDVVIYTDHLGKPAWPDGLEELDIPKIYYAVDTPINFWWQQHFAGHFDVIFVDQKPYVKEFQEKGLEAHWLPVAIDSKNYISEDTEEKIYDFAFVGVLNDKARAKRSRLVKQLAASYRVKTLGDRQEGWVDLAEATKLYRQSNLVLNENLFPGVTTRMMEAMASGTPLFTEKAGGDLGELFQAGEDFAWFEPSELMHAAEYWLSDEKRLAKMAARAQEKIVNNHDISHRAEEVIKVAAALNLSQGFKGAKAWDAHGRTLFLTALRWPGENGQRRVVRAEKYLLKAAEGGELSPEGQFMLGHIGRLKGELDNAGRWLKRSWENGYERAALGLGLLAMNKKNAAEATQWLGEFTGLGADFPQLEVGILHFEAVLPLAARSMALGQTITPGFNFLPHDPSLWTAFEFYLSAHQARPQDLAVGQSLSQLLLEKSAPAEAMMVAEATLKHHPADEILSSVYSQGAKDSYLSLN